MISFHNAGITGLFRQAVSCCRAYSEQIGVVVVASLNMPLQANIASREGQTLILYISEPTPSIPMPVLIQNMNQLASAMTV